MKVNRDAPVDGDGTDTNDQSSSPTPSGGNDEGPSGPTAADFNMDDAEELAEGSFGGETAAEVDPLSAMFQSGQGEVSGSLDQEVTADGQPVNRESEASDDEGDAEAGEEAEAQDETGETESQEGEGADETEDADGDGESQREQWLDADAFAEKTGINAEDPEEAADKVNQLKDKVAGFSELQKVIQQQPGFQRMLTEMANGKTAAEAAAQLEGVTTEAPDPQENPEAYGDWKASQKQREQEQQQQLQQQRERQQEIQQKKSRILEEFDNVVEHHDDISDEELGTTLQRLTVTAPDARFRAEDLHTLAKGLKYDDAIEQAREEAYQEGREEALQEVRGDGSVQPTDGTPDLRSRGGASEDEETHDVDVDDEVTSLFAPGRGDNSNIHDRV